MGSVMHLRASLAIIAALPLLTMCTERDISDAVIFTGGGNAALDQCSRASPPAGDGNWTPSWSEVGELEERLPAALQGRPEMSDLGGSPPTGWYRQYSGITRNGRKYIYGNFFPKREYGADGDWRANIVSVCDGGPRFFGVGYDPKLKRFEHIAFNGSLGRSAPPPAMIDPAMAQ